MGNGVVVTFKCESVVSIILERPFQRIGPSDSVGSSRLEAGRWFFRDGLSNTCPRGLGWQGHPRRRRLRAWPEQVDILVNVRISCGSCPSLARTRAALSAGLLKKEQRAFCGGRGACWEVGFQTLHWDDSSPRPPGWAPAPQALPARPQTTRPRLWATGPAPNRWLCVLCRPRLADREAGEGAPAREACSHPRGPRTFVVLEAGPFRGDALTGAPGRQVLLGSG